MKRSILLLLSLSCTCLHASVGSDAAGTIAGRSVSGTTPANAQMGVAAFAGNNAFFLGAAGLLAGNDQAVARAQLARANGVWSTEIKGLAPDTIQVNSVPAAAGQNPLTGTGITKMTLGNGNKPVVAIDPTSANKLADTGAADGNKPPWNQGGVAWSQPGGIAAPAVTVAVPAEAAKNAAATVFMVDETNGQVLVNGGTDVGLVAAAPDDTKNLNLLHTSNNLAVPLHATQGIFGLAATNVPVQYWGLNTAQFVFAGVANTADFSSTALVDGENGVAVMRVGVDLNQRDNQLLAENPTSLVTIAPNNNFAVSLVPATVEIGGAPVYVAGAAGLDMYWDDPLQRLFVALKGVQTNATNSQGAVGLAIGLFDSTGLGTFTLSPVFNDVAHFTSGSPDFIFGYVNSAALNTQTINLYKVRIMHTSTGNNYMILNGGVVANGDANNTEKSWVFALPLVAGAAVAAADVGKPASIDFDVNNVLQTVHFNTPAADSDYMTSVDRTQPFNPAPNNGIHAVVGANPSYLCHDIANFPAIINDMQVVGDTVYVSVAGTRNLTNKQEAGLFASTAIFNQAGAIRAWTPWQRVMGKIEAMDKFGFDEKGSNYWWLDTDVKEFALVTRWYAGDTSLHSDAAHVLSAALQPFADNFQGGVYGLFNFDDETPGFKVPTAGNPFPQFSMMVATGYNRVAMIQTGMVDTANADPNLRVFQQTKAFDATVAAATQNVFIFDETKLPDLGSITAAEVARVAPDVAPADAAGWLFVGGERGVAVLRKTSNGYGWANGAGLGLDQLKGAVAGDYPGGANFVFKQIAFYADQTTSLDITNVRKLVSDGTYLYILTNNALTRLTMTADTMKNGYLANDNDYQTPLDISENKKDVNNNADTAVAFALLPNQDEFFDMMVTFVDAAETHLVVATSKGLINIKVGAAGALTQIKTVLVNSTSADPVSPSLGPVLRLDFVSGWRGGQLDADDKAQGNLYALGIDANGQALNTYRFDVNGGTVSYFIEQYKTAAPVAPTDYFYQIGSIANLAPHEFSGLLDFVNYTRHFGDLATYFVDNMPMVPSTDKFLQTAPIALNADLRYWPHLGTKVLDTASGAVYVPGQFGVRVNE